MREAIVRGRGRRIAALGLVAAVLGGAGAVAGLGADPASAREEIQGCWDGVRIYQTWGSGGDGFFYPVIIITGEAC